MDQLTVDLLRSWGFEDYIYVFADGKIDSGTLRILSEDEIRQLIPVPGDRARFKLNVRNWKKELASLNVGSEIDSSFELPELPGTSDLALGTLLRECTEDTDLLDLDDRNLNPSAIRHSHIGEPNKSNTEKENIPHGERCVGVSEAPERGYVMKILKATIDGRALLSKREEGRLDDTQRNILCKLLIQPLFEENPNALVTNKQLLAWSLQIQEIFKKESSALYYTPYVSALVHTTARNASGKLLRYVYNKRQQLRSRGIIPRARSRSSNRASSSSSNSDVAPPIRLTAASAESSEEVEEKLNWLKNSLEPWHLVTKNWTATAAFRLNNNYLAGSSLQEYFNEYPVLRCPTGYELLHNDFKAMYKDKADALFTSIILLRDKITEIARKKVESTRDRDIKVSMLEYLNIISDTEDQDIINNGALLLLPYIASSVPLKEKKKTLWKPSKSEVRDGFVTQIGSDAELDTVVTSRKNKLQRYAKTLQPFVVFVGPSIADISHCFIVAGDTYYKINKLLNAVDICFKIFHATGAKYQSEAFVVWMLIQKAFYRIDTPYDKELTTVKSLLIDFGI